MNNLPLELLIHILSPLDVRELIKLRRVSKKWMLVIDRYLLLELNFFNNKIYVRSIFIRYNQSHSDQKNSIKHFKNPIHKSVVNFEKVQFLFRNAKKLNLCTNFVRGNPTSDFISG